MIKVTDKLPECTDPKAHGYVQVLVVVQEYYRISYDTCGPSQHFAIAMYNKKHGFCIDGEKVDKLTTKFRVHINQKPTVTYWQYMPKFPKIIKTKNKNNGN